MSDYIWWSTIVDPKLLSDLVIYSINSFDIPVEFHKLIQAVSPNI